VGFNDSVVPVVVENAESKHTGFFHPRKLKYWMKANRKRYFVRIQTQPGIGMSSASMINYADHSGGPVPPHVFICGEVHPCVPLGISTWETGTAIRNFRFRKLE
jgi:hypothetical protein